MHSCFLRVIRENSVTDNDSDTCTDKVTIGFNADEPMSVRNGVQTHFEITLPLSQLMCQSKTVHLSVSENGRYVLFTLHGTGTGNGTRNGKRWVSILHYVMYTLHSDRGRDSKPLFSIVSIPVPVPLSVPCSVYEPLDLSDTSNLFSTNSQR